MKSAIKNVITLTIITVVAGFLLGYVYDITKQPIADMQEKTKQEAYMKVFPQAASFENLGSIDETTEQSVLQNAQIEGVNILEALNAVDASGSKLGYVITAVSHDGYGGDIKISMGISLEGTVLGVEILEISETAGLGMKADTDDFKKQFRDKTVGSFTYTKSGATQDSEIDAISGATFTTKAFVNAVNGGLAYFEYLGGASNA